MEGQHRRDITPELVKEMRADGLSITAIAHELNCSYGTIAARLDNLSRPGAARRQEIADGELALGNLKQIALLHSWELGFVAAGKKAKFCRECGDQWPCVTRQLSDLGGQLHQSDGWGGGAPDAFSDEPSRRASTA